MATAIEKPCSSSAKMKPPIPPKPVGISSVGERERNGDSPSMRKSCTPIAELFTSDSDQADTRSDAGATTSKKEGTKVVRSHSALTAIGSQHDSSVKLKRHHSAREGKESSAKVPPSDQEVLEDESSKEPRHKEKEDLQTRMRDCLWTPLASFVVRTKAGGAALVERGSKRLFSGRVFSQKKHKKPLPALPSNGDSIRTRPEVPPRPVLLRILQSIRQSEPGIWHQLDHVKYIDEDASTEDSTDYTDVDWGKALSDSGDEEIIYYTYIEEKPNEKVVFFHRMHNRECYSSSDDQDEIIKEDLRNHVASMENMDIEVIDEKGWNDELEPQNEELVVESLEDAVPSEIAATVLSVAKPSTPSETSTMKNESEVILNGDENANLPTNDENGIVEMAVEENVNVACALDNTRKNSPQYAYVQKYVSEHARPPSSGNASESYYDLDVKPKIKPRRPPLPARKPSRPAPPVPPKTYKSIRVSRSEIVEEQDKSTAEDIPKVMGETVSSDIFTPEKDQVFSVTTVELARDSTNSHLSNEENMKVICDIDEQACSENNQECASPDPSFIVHEDTDGQLKEHFEIPSTISESHASPTVDDMSERRSQWANSEFSLDTRPSYHWDSRSVSIPLSFTSESGFISSPTPPPRRRKKRHHSVDGFGRIDSPKEPEDGGRRSKSCSDAEMAKLTSESPCIEDDAVSQEACSPIKPQRPPRPALKSKPERPPKPKPVTVRKLAASPVVREEASSAMDTDRESVVSSREGSPKIRMNERPLPPPPAPPRQRSPWVTKKIFKTSSVKSLDDNFVRGGHPVGNIKAKFSADFLDRVAEIEANSLRASEIEANSLRVSELKVHKILVDEIDASVIRVGTIHVGQITPLALIMQSSDKDKSTSLLDEKGGKLETSDVAEKHSVDECSKPKSEKNDEQTKALTEQIKMESEKVEEKNKSDEEEQKEKSDEENPKDGKQNKKDDEDDKGNGGGLGGDKSNDKDGGGGDGDGNGDGKRDGDSEPPSWWKESEPASDQQYPSSDSVMTGQLSSDCNQENKIKANNLGSTSGEQSVSDRLIATDTLVVTNSIFYLGDKVKAHSPSPTPSQKSICSNSSAESKKDNVKIVGRSSWYDEGHAGDVDTSDGWVEGKTGCKDVCSQETNKERIVDSDVEDVSQIRRQLASLVSVHSQESRRSSQHRVQDDHLSSSSTTDVEQDEPKRAHSHKHYHRTHSTSSQDSSRLTQTESDWPKLDPNANYYNANDCEMLPSSDRNLAQNIAGSNANNPQSSANGLHVNDEYSPVKHRSSSSHCASSNVHDPSRRLTNTSLLSLPTSEDSWHNCVSGDESDTESFITSHSCFEDGDAVERKARKRFYIAKELMTSEKVFVDVLKLLNEDFRDVVMQASKMNSNTVIPESVLNHILQYLPQLQNLNEDLLKDLTERIEKWDEIGQIADVIVKKGPFLKLYSSYIKDFESITASLNEACRKFPGFAQVVKEFEMSERCQRLGIRHYLLKPVQRIPQYKLLLEDYLKHLSPESVDYQDTITALTIVSDVANHANQTMKQGDNFAKLLEIQNNLIGNYEIIKPGRVFLKEGELYKLSRKVMQPRWFILFNDSLLHTDMQQQGCYRLHHDFPLAGMKVMLPTNEEYQNEFSIISVARSFTLSAPSPHIRDEWIKALNEAIEANVKRRGTFASAIDKKEKVVPTNIPILLGKQAPVWIPDARVTMCQLCTCEFTVTFRRHHCRACGKVVCSNCSANRAPLQYLNYESARVCDECYEKLSEEFEASEHTVNESAGSTECGESDDKASGNEDNTCASTLKANLKAQFKRYGIAHGKKEKRHLPKVLKEVCANHQGALHSGYLQKRVKKSWRKLWFVINDKVMYTYKACEDVAALESIPLLGFTVVLGPPDGQVFETVNNNFIFHLSHPGQSSMIFCADSDAAVEKWTKAMESASVLE